MEGFEEYRNSVSPSKSVEQPNGSSVGMAEDTLGVDGNTANTETGDSSDGWAGWDGYETLPQDSEYWSDYEDSPLYQQRRQGSRQQ